MNGYTGAQYINAAYRVSRLWVNNAGFARTGTITATQVIPAGREILMPYHAAYWRRWGLATARGCPRNDGARSAVCAGGPAAMRDEAEGVATPLLQPQHRREQHGRGQREAGGIQEGSKVRAIGGGKRVVAGAGTRAGRSGVKRAERSEEEAPLEKLRRVSRADEQWSSPEYDMFVRRVVRHERGEGGGVT